MQTAMSDRTPPKARAALLRATEFPPRLGEAPEFAHLACAIVENPMCVAPGLWEHAEDAQAQRHGHPNRWRDSDGQIVILPLDRFCARIEAAVCVHASVSALGPSVHCCACLINLTEPSLQATLGVRGVAALRCCLLSNSETRTDKFSTIAGDRG